ncbi:hypothetical protein F4678DRAFT_428389 [Xylaria arbuscula]|nr:hypothetical protein F4678DRAFT_428389 [Xylaria arbuscula]
MLFSVGRFAAGRLASTTLVATPSTSSAVFRATARVQFRARGIYTSSPLSIRALATAGRPKKASPSQRATKTAAKKPAKKSTATTKAKAKSKAKPKAKPKAKSKAKPKPKPTPAKRTVSPERKALLERRALKHAALFAEPKSHATQPWPLFVAEKTQGSKDGTVAQRMASLSLEYKALPSSEIQRLRSKAQQTKATDEVNYKAWIESHTPQEIYDANNARKSLKKKYNVPKGTVKILRDERVPKRPATAYSLFTKARWASGDYSSAGPAFIRDTAQSIAQEWKNLTPAERKPYEDQAKSESDSYRKVVDVLLPGKRVTARKSPSP